MCYSVLQCVAVCCSVLQCITVCCIMASGFLFLVACHVQIVTSNSHTIINSRDCTLCHAYLVSVCAYLHHCTHCIYIYIYALTYIVTDKTYISTMGWLPTVGSFKLQVFSAEFSLFYRAVLQKRPIISRSLLIVSTPRHYKVA